MLPITNRIFNMEVNIIGLEDVTNVKIQSLCITIEIGTQVPTKKIRHV